MNHTNEAMAVAAQLYFRLRGMGVHINADGSLWGEPGSALTDPRLHALLVEFRPALMVFLHEAHKTTSKVIIR